jgi:hypothetical protein
LENFWVGGTGVAMKEIVVTVRPVDWLPQAGKDPLAVLAINSFLITSSFIRMLLLKVLEN